MVQHGGGRADGGSWDGEAGEAGTSDGWRGQGSYCSYLRLAWSLGVHVPHRLSQWNVLKVELGHDLDAVIGQVERVECVHVGDQVALSTQNIKYRQFFGGFQCQSILARRKWMADGILRFLGLGHNTGERFVHVQ